MSFQEIPIYTHFKNGGFIIGNVKRPQHLIRVSVPKDDFSNHVCGVVELFLRYNFPQGPSATQSSAADSSATDSSAASSTATDSSTAGSSATDVSAMGILREYSFQEMSQVRNWKPVTAMYNDIDQKSATGRDVLLYIIKIEKWVPLLDMPPPATSA